MPNAATAQQRQPPPPPGSPPSFISLGEIAAELNAPLRLKAMPEKWNRWNTRTLCEAAGVRFVQRAPGSKLFALGRELEESGMWAAIVKARADAEDARGWRRDMLGEDE